MSKNVFKLHPSVCAAVSRTKKTVYQLGTINVAAEMLAFHRDLDISVNSLTLCSHNVLSLKILSND